MNLHRLEIRSFLDNVPHERLWALAICRTVTELVADIGGLVNGGAVLVDSEDVVLRLRRSQRAREIYRRAYSTNEAANRANRKRFRAGKFTGDLERELQTLYLRRIGDIRAGSFEDQQLQAVPPESIPSIICEWEATKESWQEGRAMNSNQQRDLFHVTVALPYTDVMLTYESRLRRMIRAVAGRVPFPVATVVGSMAELLAGIDRRPVP